PHRPPPPFPTRRSSDLPATANLDVQVGPTSAKIVQMTNQVFHSLGVLAAGAGRQSYDLNSPVAAGAFFALSTYVPAAKPDLWSADRKSTRLNSSHQIIS